MTRSPWGGVWFRVLMVALATGAGGACARAQSGAAMLADDIIILSKGQNAKEQARSESLLGAPPGTAEVPFSFEPGTSASLLERRQSAPFAPRRPRDVLAAISEGRGPSYPTPPPPRPAPPSPTPRAAAPLEGSLELPRGDDEGPPDGLTLDMALDRLVHENPDLRTKYFEIPMGDADILSAGLRANPILFASADSVPYGSYTTRRPGSNDYTVVWVQPVDVSGKVRARTVVARQARRVLEAQFQDEVRRQIDNLYAAWVDVLSQREAVRFRRASLAGLTRLEAQAETRFRKGSQLHTDVDAIAIQRETTEVSLHEDEAALRKAKQVLGFFLGIPDAQADGLEIRGLVRDDRLAPPPVEELVRIALDCRPDLHAFRLGVQRSEANVALERANRFEDVFILYTPATYTNQSWTNQQSSTSWSLGGVVSLPLFNRNQGNIARARLNVSQTQSELARMERLVAVEVRRAWTDYTTSRDAADRIRGVIVPRARHLRDEKAKLFAAGEADAATLLGAQRDYNDVLRRYRDTVVRHRRDALRLNTVVGVRLLP